MLQLFHQEVVRHDRLISVKIERESGGRKSLEIITLITRIMAAVEEYVKLWTNGGSSGSSVSISDQIL